MIRTEEGSVLYLYTKFEADSSIRSKIITGSKNFEIGSCDPGHAHLGVVLWSVRREGPSSMSLPNLKRISFRSEVIWGAKILKLGHVPRPRPFRGRFMVPMQEGSVLHLCTKFKADCSIHSKVIKGSQNLEISSRDPSYAHLGVIL